MWAKNIGSKQDMEVQSSNDLMMDSEDPPGTATLGNSLTEKPIMQFFRRLILNDKNYLQNIILTDSQLEDMLEREFNFNLLSFHPLEVDIYVIVLKKHLKEWPQWDELDNTIKAHQKNMGVNTESFLKILEAKYEILKGYLKKNLDTAHKLSEEFVNKVKATEKKEPEKIPESKTVILEIKATREQLNKLIYRHPHPEYNHTIFNAEDRAAPSQIRLNTASLEAILNWWAVRITISLQMNTVFLSRETTHKLEHKLVNRIGGNDTLEPVTLDEEIQLKDTKKSRKVLTKQLLGCLDLLSMKHDAEMEGMEIIIDFLRKDLLGLPICIAPAHYRRYLFKHPYVRYLYTDVEIASNEDKEKYDIQLQETISPMHQFFIGRMDGIFDSSLPPQWLKVECVKCNQTFSGATLATELKQHFDEYHQVESDWICTNCCKSYSMARLAENWWAHDCRAEVIL